jgi:hypothetical protein
VSTSGTTTGLATAGDIVRRALELIQVFDPGEEVTPADMATGLKHLNWMLKAMQGDGCNLFRDERITITWPGGTVEGSLSPSVIDVIDVRFQQSSTFERQLSRWERGEYNQIPNKAQAGDPLAYTVIKRTGAIRMSVWPVPADDVTLNCDVARVIEDVTAHTQNVDVPQEWTEAVIYNLADRLAPVFGVQSPVTDRALALYVMMRDADRPGSYFLTR